MSRQMPRPLIDKRTPAEIAEQTRKLLRDNLQDYGWNEQSDGGEAGRALVGVFAHYCGLVIERINRAPEKNFLAFLDLLGNSLTPPRPAQAPLSFFLDPAAPSGIAIPAGTRVQAEAPAGAKEPVVFETDGDVWLSHFQLLAMSKRVEGTSQPRDITDLLLATQKAQLKPLSKKERITADEKLFDEKETLYFGLGLPEGVTPEVNRPLTLYFFIGAPDYDATQAPVDANNQPTLVWEYLSGSREAPEWKGLLVEDGSQGLSQSGPVTFLIPGDVGWLQRHLFQSRRYWIRAYLLSGKAQPDTGLSDAELMTRNKSNARYDPAPRLQGVALHTVMATQAVTVRDEVLGSSNGNPGQRFTSFRRPVLEGQRLEVLEHPADRRQDDPAAGWISWLEVPDFHGSTPHDRHYVIDRQSGEIRFGDGQAGMTPPPGTRNLRLAAYRSGGGTGGNLPAGAVKSLVAGIRYVDKVTNFAPAAGGAAGESTDSLLERAPKALRHRGRAVTDEDFEDLAKLASNEVARALCVPLADLASEPGKLLHPGLDDEAGAGKVSVIIVPRLTDPKPLPSQTLLHRVTDYLRQRAGAGVSVAVVGPLYLRVNVDIAVKLESLSLENQVRVQVEQALASFLHPLTGRYGQGWPFGRVPHASDLYRLLRDIPGIRHISSLSITLDADSAERPLGCELSSSALDCIERTGRFLIHSGEHELTPS